MKKTSALLVLIFCTLLPVCGISGQCGLSPDTVFELVTQSENPQFPDIQMKELLIN